MPFSLDISNRASGVSALPIEYLPPVVSPGGSPSGTLPGGQAIAADAAGHAQIYWPRGLPCALFLRAIVEEEGFMRSGGVVIGGATTRLVSYRYLGGENDASNASGAGGYDAGEPLRIQWNTPLPNGGSYPDPGRADGRDDLRRRDGPDLRVRGLDRGHRRLLRDQPLRRMR